MGRRGGSEITSSDRIITYMIFHKHSSKIELAPLERVCYVHLLE